MDFRRAEPVDAELLTKLSLASKRHWGYSDEFMNAIQAELVVDADQILNGYCEISQLHGNATGFILLLKGAGFVEVEALFINPDCIGTGLGAKLLARGIEWAKSNKFQSVRTTADPNALGFYEKHGFVKIEDIPSKAIPNRSLPRLELRLDEV